MSKINEIALAHRCMQSDTILDICEGPGIAVSCGFCPVNTYNKNSDSCTPKMRRDWARTVLHPPVAATVSSTNNQITYKVVNNLPWSTLPKYHDYIPREEVQKEPLTQPQPMFQPRTRGNHEYVIYKIYSEEDSSNEFVIHGAIDYGNGWEAHTWTLAGRNTRTIQNELDLLPLKPRKCRFKTAEELVAARPYAITIMYNGYVEVKDSGVAYVRTASDTLEGNYTEEWLQIFTVEEET